MKHTHRGTCQVCGAVQAVMAKGLIAKHGYTVDWGYFNGVCAGADHQPIELDKTLAEATVKALREEVIPQARAAMHGLQNGSITPAWTKQERYNVHRFRTVPATREELTNDEAQRLVFRAIRNEESRIVGAKQHAQMIEALIPERFTKPLYPALDSDRKELKAGVEVRVGGKTGWTGKIIEVKGAIAKGQGPNLNGRYMEHAFIQGPRGNVVPIPTRLIRQSAIV